MMGDIDWKNVGVKAIDIVAGIGGAVAGAYGGPAAATGIQTAGGAIKSFIDDGSGEAKMSRREQHDRQDFQARTKVLPPAQASATANPDEAIARAELAKLGYSAQQIDTIIAGPSRPGTQATATAAATAPKDVPVVPGESTKAVDWKKIAEVAGTAIKGAVGTSADTYEGTNTAALEKTGTRILAGSEASTAKG